MPPKLYLVRHGESEHNVENNWDIPDPGLTTKGRKQCYSLRNSFPFHAVIDLVVSSPLRRAIQSAVLGFGPTLARPEVPFLLLPSAQEVGHAACDTGLEPDELRKFIAGHFAEDEQDLEVEEKINMDAVEKGWNVKSGYWAYTHEALLKRASDFRGWLWQRPEAHILVVTHGAFLHFLTEDWEVENPMITTAYLNCEVRQFLFTPGSTAENAHIEETANSKITRGANKKEEDLHVPEELKTVTGDVM